MLGLFYLPGVRIAGVGFRRVREEMGKWGGECIRVVGTKRRDSEGEVYDGVKFLCQGEGGSGERGTEWVYQVWGEAARGWVLWRVLGG